MNKSDLVRTLSQKERLPIKNAKMVVDLFFNLMTEDILKGQKIEVRGFGSFTVREYKAYTGRNPRTGELTHVQEKKLPFFNMGKELRERLIDGGGDESREQE